MSVFLQLSALALLAPVRGGPLWLAAGLWVANTVELRPVPGTEYPDLDPIHAEPPGASAAISPMRDAAAADSASRASSVPHQPPAVTIGLGQRQPRAIAVGELGGGLRLFIGTACGELVVQGLAGSGDGAGPQREGLRLLERFSYQARHSPTYAARVCLGGVCLALEHVAHSASA